MCLGSIVGLKSLIVVCWWLVFHWIAYTRAVNVLNCILYVELTGDMLKWLAWVNTWVIMETHSSWILNGWYCIQDSFKMQFNSLICPQEYSNTAIILKEKWGRKTPFFAHFETSGVHVTSMWDILKCYLKYWDGCRSGIVSIFIPNIQLMALHRHLVLSQGSMHTGTTIN